MEEDAKLLNDGEARRTKLAGLRVATVRERRGTRVKERESPVRDNHKPDLFLFFFFFSFNSLSSTHDVHAQFDDENQTSAWSGVRFFPFRLFPASLDPPPHPRVDR